ncbi:MAG: RnfABCDGE type electron transport complex subunit D [Candidatus Levybacteria bacterium]|nr:RnfABCDGE type electron transport complex subunit D [Candidatus Levybacteria bacterium]
MLEKIDYILDRVTMYKLILYVLTFLFGIAIILSFFEIIHLKVHEIIFSVTVLTVVSYIANKIFSFILKASTNSDSIYITALILTFLITPVFSVNGFIFLSFTATLAMLSKYILAIGKKHIFNPAAISVVIAGILTNQYASWWIGISAMSPFLFIGGFLIVRKINRELMVLSFFVSLFLALAIFSFINADNFLTNSQNIFFNSVFLFLAFIMLTEPATTPPTKKLQIIYGAIVGFLYMPYLHIGNIYSTPELALVLGNVFSFIVSPRYKLFLKLKEKIKISPEVIDFSFVPDKKFTFIPGQYMEWTLPHKNIDGRGNRRFFTIASSPGENYIHLGVKFSQDGSSFKRALSSIEKTDTIVASQIAGEFTLPQDANLKLVFIAGGIGITPFRSIIKFLIDTNSRRRITLFYANKISSEIMYEDVFDRAESQLGIKIVYTLTDTENVPKDWKGKIGRIDENMIKKEVPDYKNHYFYLSGPHEMIKSFEKILTNMGIDRKMIKTDYFPGYT